MHKNKQKADIRLPIPCPLPAAFSPAVQVAIQQNKLTGLLKLSMLRECSTFFQGICPRPKPFEYLEMSKFLCDKYPALRDEVSFNENIGGDGIYLQGVKFLNFQYSCFDPMLTQIKQ